MRPLSLFIMISTSFPSLSMEKLIHYLDKSVDPMTYITQGESIKHCQEILKLNPSHTHHEKFEIGKKWTDPKEGNIGKATRRQKQLLIEAEGSIVGYDDRWFYFYGTYRSPNPAIAESIIRAHEQISGYFSPHLIAVLRGYATYKMKKDQSTAHILDSFLRSAQNLPPSQNEPTTSETQKREYTETTTYETFKDKVLKDNFNWLEGLNNYWRKNMSDTLGHLTHDKTKMFSAQLLRYDPAHIGHTSDLWHLNPDNDVHKKHMHKTFERERLLCDLVCESIIHDDYETLLTVSPVNPNNPNAVTIPAGYFSPVLMAIILGYLEAKATTTALNVNIGLGSKLLNQDKSCSCNKSDCKECTERNNLEKNCTCNPSKKLKDCELCLKIPKTPPPPVPVDLESDCNCYPQKKLKDCELCFNIRGLLPQQ